jgi:hypothetical protein
LRKSRRISGFSPGKGKTTIAMSMQMEEARAYVMQALRRPHWSQIEEILLAIGSLKSKAVPRAQGQYQISNYGITDARGHLDPGDRMIIHEILWSLIVQGILVPGLDDNNSTLPFIRLTEYGKRCVAEDRILPHDPDGYLSEFQNVVPSADPAIVEYLTEALACFIHGLNRSSAIMLGGASEKAILTLIGSYAASIADLNKKANIENQIEKASSIFRKYEVFDKQFPAFKQKLPRELAENVDSLLRGVFDLIRNSRNDSGHPASGVYVDRDTNYSHLKLFVPYCRRIYGLIEWFEHNQT